MASQAIGLAGKTLFITGASRGIGLSIALRAARDGANIVVAAKTLEPHPKLPGTIETAAQAIEEVGGQALPLQLDIRDAESVEKAVVKAANHFGGLDILINNASAISLTGCLDTPIKRYDLMQAVNARGTFVCSQAAIPFLNKSANPHILVMAPPLNLKPHWLGPHLAYSMAKYGMSFCVIGLAEEFRSAGIAVNALWPASVISTAALNLLPGMDPAKCRKPEIVADAAHQILVRDSRTHSGRFFIDEEVLKDVGIEDLEPYAIDPTHELQKDLFLD